ncbi:carboxymuconolactone decarboxylase family protein [Photobacterium halotolerans]|uniref:carboxymuconolactone decarboxylase family protein n=1 Tax=Photobacterium halotolerans TaxID=265726 RepID=UPI0013731064|nr:carboxymuconolactone decarboxylase family protein [Photobacterium halotolerans]NAX45699.1 carboxymuconolactone decarboxylase family protein [Photobacterium halotolerans]
MIELEMHTVQSAPEDSRKLLQSSIDNFGWIPNQSAYMAESPALLSSYQYAHDRFSDCSLSDEEKAVVWITTGLLNQCRYTVQAHRWIALKKGVAADTLTQLETNPDSLPEKLRAIHRFTQVVVKAQGIIPQPAAMDFLRAGYTRQNMLDIILGVSQKTMSTLLNSLAGTQIEPEFMNVS